MRAAWTDLNNSVSLREAGQRVQAVVNKSTVALIICTFHWENRYVFCAYYIYVYLWVLWHEVGCNDGPIQFVIQMHSQLLVCSHYLHILSISGDRWGLD